MSPRRLWIVYALLAVLVGGHLYDALRFQEHWPFSNYPMFAGIAQPELTTYQLIGLSGDREVPIDNRAIPALPPYKFQGTLRRYDTTSKADPQKLRAMLSDYLDAYETRRVRHLHDGPPLDGIRLYLVRIPIQLPPVPVDLKHGDHGDHPRMVMEVRRPDRGAT
ncbi:MAG TPA: hypothetical protein VLI90_08140 [Tepidisphaeraceae bacterium]|nr:hypothetical protein [Tepidisphaeraceae bacterium]